MPHALPPPAARGFTIVEVMLVTLLLGVLASIAAASYQSYRDRVREHSAAEEIAAMSAQISRIPLERRTLPDTLDEAGFSGRLDPWGRPYVYYNVEANGRGGARKDKRLNPLNTDFDLYSLGKDGKTKPQISQKDSLDDLIRAGNGRYVGRADGY